MRPRIELQGERLFKIRIIVPSWTSDHEDCWVACGGVGGPCVSDSCVGYCCSASQDDLNPGCSQEMIDFLAENAENEYMHQCVYDENEVMVPTTTTTTTTTTTPVKYYGSNFAPCWIYCEGKGGACRACNGYCCAPNRQTQLNGDCPTEAVEFLILYSQNQLHHQLG